MSDFNPGDDWRVHDELETPPGTLAWRDEEGDWHYWVRKEPMPPLPTEPNTVIRVTWRPHPDDMTEATDFILRDLWWAAGGVEDYDPWQPESLARVITGFEVLAEPKVTSEDISQETDLQFEDRVRRETARDMLNAIRNRPLSYWNQADIAVFTTVARQFGLDS